MEQTTGAGCDKRREQIPEKPKIVIEVLWVQYYNIGGRKASLCELNILYASAICNGWRIFQGESMNYFKDIHTKDEILQIKARLNLTSRESALLDYRAQGYSLEKCAELLDISVKTTQRVNKSLTHKYLAL